MTTPTLDEAVSYFLDKYRRDLPRREDGSVDVEFLCGEFLAEGSAYEEVKAHYDALPTEMKREDTDPVRKLQHEVRELEQWKKSAMQVLGEWEKVWEAAGKPGRLGASKAKAVREFLENKRAQP